MKRLMDTGEETKIYKDCGANLWSQPTPMRNRQCAHVIPAAQQIPKRNDESLACLRLTKYGKNPTSPGNPSRRMAGHVPSQQISTSCAKQEKEKAPRIALINVFAEGTCTCGVRRFLIKNFVNSPLVEWRVLCVNFFNRHLWLRHFLPTDVLFRAPGPSRSASAGLQPLTAVIADAVPYRIPSVHKLTTEHRVEIVTLFAGRPTSLGGIRHG
ncbi:hypothetical protein EVAR_14429_1 [Eumeta japonica]|uniref:Uncharacterized protein n=1 Tax=Eumeta variegata TaxID=151549 RepID=A0A4C1TX95_EUMVA|nr:hypothetical protein EVAR_14429_1 [Eumeta japonica]